MLAKSYVLVKKGFHRVVPDALVYIAFDVLIKCISFMTLPLFTNIMSPEEFGQFSLYTTYISILSVFFGLSVSRAIVNYYYYEEIKLKSPSTALWLVIITSLLFFTLIYLSDLKFHYWNISNKTLVTIMFTTIFSSITVVGMEILRAHKKGFEYGFLNALNVILSTFLSLLFIYNLDGDTSFWRLLSLFFGNLLIGIIMIIYIVRADKMKFDKVSAKYLLSFSLPLIPFAFASLAISFSDRIFLEYYTTTTEVGIYSFGYSIGMLYYAVAMGLNKALQPVVFKNYKNKEILNKVFKKYILIFSAFYTVFVMFDDLLVNLLGNEQYYSSIKIIPIIAMSYGFYYLFSLYELHLSYHKKTKFIMFSGLITAGLNIGLNFIFIPIYGFVGAAITTLISYMLLFVITYLFVEIRMHIRLLSIFKVLLLSCYFIICAVISYLLS